MTESEGNLALHGSLHDEESAVDIKDSGRNPALHGSLHDEESAMDVTEPTVDEESAITITEPAENLRIAKRSALRHITNFEYCAEIRDLLENESVNNYT